MLSWGTPTPGIGKRCTAHLQLLKSMADDTHFWANDPIRNSPKFKAYLKRREGKKSLSKQK